MSTPNSRAARRDDISRARLEALVRSSADAIVGATLDGVITDWNPAAERLYGYSAEEVIGQRTGRLIQREHAAEAEAILARVLRGESVDVETVRFARDGQRREVSITVFPIWNDAGEIVATSAIVRDITAQNAAAGALAASETRFRLAFENAPIGMALVGADERTVQVNRALCAMLGYSEAELLGTTLRALTHPDDIAANAALVERAQAGELEQYALEKRYLRKDGRVLWALLTTSFVRDAAGAPLYFISQIQDISERKAAEQVLAESQRQIQEVLERITDSFYALDRDWRFTYVNAAAERIFNRPRADLLGKNVWEEFASSLETPVHAAYHEAMRSGTPAELEFFYPAFNEWYELHIYPSAEGLAIFFRDVTERRRLTEELRASEKQFRTLVEQIPAVVYLLAADDAQTRLYFSPYLETLTGYCPEEAVAQADHWLDWVHPDDHERVERAHDPAEDDPNDETFRVEYRHRRKDGGYVWVQDECIPIRDDGGEIVAWQGILLDITDRVAAEETRAQLAALVESAEDAIVSSSLEGMIISWNSGAEQLYGYRAEEIVGQPAMLLGSNLSSEPEREERLAAARAGHPVAPFETVRRRRDGTTFAASIALSSIRDRNGAVIGLSSITRDITERNRADAELRAALEAAQAATRTKSLFLAMMSHELRTPLQAILGYADFLLADTGVPLTSQQVEDVQSIHRGALRMVELIEQMLDLSRMEAGRLELETKAVHLAEILEQVRQDVAPQCEAKRLRLTITVPAALPAALGDPVRLRQILLNLVGNAVKFTEEGAVEVAATATAAGLSVSVRDTGIGIAAEALPHIFEEFRQVDGNLTRRYGGAGLGLAIAKRLAEQMSGGITVESTPDAGSTFTLTVPAAG